MPELDRDAIAARADLCRFLAACYYEPGPEFAEEKVFASMQAAASRIDPDLAAMARRLGEAFLAEVPEDLLVDYTRLFLGPVEALARPYASVWMGGDKALMQETTMAVVKLYEEGGFEIADDFRELPDHIAVELEFLYLLLFRESLALGSAGPAAQPAAAALRKHFLDGHLARWVGPFTAALKGGAQSAFYRELAELTHRFVTLEAARLTAA
jgi:TorA maturation chaperone TorD